MKAIVVKSPTSIADLEIGEVDRPKLVGSEKILVKIKAIGVNPIDWKQIEGIVPATRPLDSGFIPGSDFSGIILEVGDGISHLRKGDSVFGFAGIGRNGSGAFAEIAMTDASFVGKKPHSLSFLEAAAVPMAGLRAWHSLKDLLEVKQGERVLIHGGSGGIGSFALPIAKYLGADVTTTASSLNVEYIKAEYGCQVIDYQKQDFSEVLRDFDAVFDTIGGETFVDSFKVLRRGGRITTVFRDRYPELEKKHFVKFVPQGESANQTAFKILNTLFESKVLTVKIDKVFPFSEFRFALEYQKSGHPKGKVVISMDHGEGI